MTTKVVMKISYPSNASSDLDVKSAAYEKLYAI